MRKEMSWCGIEFCRIGSKYNSENENSVIIKTMRLCFTFREGRLQHLKVSRFRIYSKPVGFKHKTGF